MSSHPHPQVEPSPVIKGPQEAAVRKVVYVSPHIDTVPMTDHYEYLVEWVVSYLHPSHSTQSYRHCLEVEKEWHKSYEEARNHWGKLKDLEMQTRA